MKEITIIFRDGSDVGLGVLDETGRKFLHIRFIKNAGQGGTELADKAVEIPIDDVEIVKFPAAAHILDIDEPAAPFDVTRGFLARRHPALHGGKPT